MVRRKKRILVICPKGDLNSGGVISNYELIKYLRRNNHEIRVVTSWQGTYNETLTKDGISNVSIPYNWWTPRDTAKDISYRVVNGTIAIVDEIKSFKPDVVMTNTSHIPWGALAASMTNTPHIWIVREYPINNFAYLADKVPFIRQYSNKIMANSAELADFYNNTYKYDVGRFMSYVDIDDIKLQTLPRLVTHLVSPNYMSETKNQIELIRAVGTLKSRRKDLNFRVILMGEKEKTYWSKLQASIKQNGVSDIIDVYDRIDRPWEMVDQDDILIQTSLSESIGRTTTEAMKLGVSVIATDIPGHREAFGLGGGTLYELGNSDDLADKIEYILDHPKEARKNADKARVRALKNMSSDASSGAVAEAIESIISTGNPMGVNALIQPYFSQYVQDTRVLEQDTARKNAETEALNTAIDELRGSRSYRIGKAQTTLVKKVLNFTKKGRNK